MIEVVNIGLQPLFQAGLRSVCALVVVLLYTFWRRKRLSITDGSFGPGIIIGTLFATEFVFLFFVTGLHNRCAHLDLILFYVSLDEYWSAFFDRG